MASNFFERPQAAAKLKHAVLGKYLRIFVHKLGSTSPGKRVAFLDGYAGPGVYEDKTPGSPALALAIADLVSDTDDLIGFVVEAKKALHDDLKALVTASRPDWFVYHGHIEQHLDDILTRAGIMPMFAFLDPFGLGVPLATLTDKLLARSPSAMVGRKPRAATEVLLNFSLPGLRRNAGHLDSTSADPQYQRSRQTILARVDASMGGQWWRSMWQNGSPIDREQVILDNYLQRLQCAAGGWKVTAVPVANRWQGPPLYYLVHVTQHPDGVWHFNNALSTALEEYRRFCIEATGQLDLEPLADRERVWIAHISDNIEALVRQGPFVIGSRVTEVFGDTLGWARETHVRSAIKALHANGIIVCDSKGNVRAKRVIAQVATKLF